VLIRSLEIPSLLMRRTPLLVVVVVVTGCGRAPAPRQTRDVDARAAKHVAVPAAPDARSDAGPAGGSKDAGAGGPEHSDAAVGRRGLSGRIIDLEAGKRGKILVFRAGEMEHSAWSGRPDGEGRFSAPDLDAGEYRVIVPGDGLHGTADTYAFVTSGVEAEIEVHRPRGCPIVVTFRDAAKTAVKGARVDLSLPDLEHVTERTTVEVTTDDRGRIKVLGTCVIGIVRGVIRPEGALPHEFEHGTVGNGHDNFEVDLPGPPDAGSTPPPGATE
jgi:hypothetical protein